MDGGSRASGDHGAVIRTLLDGGATWGIQSEKNKADEESEWARFQAHMERLGVKPCNGDGLTYHIMIIGRDEEPRYSLNDILDAVVGNHNVS